MGKQHTNIKPQPAKPGDQRKIDFYFQRLDASHQNPVNLVLHYIFVPLMVLGLLGMAWAIPFPHIGLIGKYNGYFNWASFIIAFGIYYYLKMSPLLSYFALFMFFGFSYGIMQLELYQKAGGAELSAISVAILMISLAGQYIGGKIERNDQSFTDDTKLLHVTPLWVLYRLARRLGLKY
ncbi:Mpo1-like protein [Mucilaginibacter phyllosphaerae]|uniref:DUF962 domain-containing protein n=1 Tax=Mucilaginibacter phyllosphaerae TaxID=1812349 RepID=A0A4Y8A9Y9_9SPHI|nr:Mpo1-like protein [Mucilaginibacter phyllosphaerae]MBB3970693.1 putative membrane protein YGL010W [Mucilaginibacter phyllosphaerae]TEW64694.1 DUF962 domain-containing protein [Mucilaginibacter phyllosphaerae]GGH20318.1 hypothetical protein GCM10007352_32240 [Mucilaginibacter phyllosphaerae]